MDPSRDLNKRLKGLFIISKDNLVALIYDDSTRYTEVATINFEFPSIIYKLSLPKIYNMQTGIFVSESVYYTASYSDTFFQDDINSLALDSSFNF
jgi:hypothetical protein